MAFTAGFCHRRDDPFGLAHPIEIEMGVHARNAPLEPRQEGRVVVDGAIGADVELGTVKDGERLVTPSELIDHGSLLQHPVARKAVDCQVLTVFGDGHVFEAALRSRGDHFLQRAPAVSRPRRMDVEITTHIGNLHQVGQVTCGCGLDLADVLAQLGWNELETERLIDRFLGARCDHGPRARFRQLILVEDPAAVDRALPQGDVVCLRPREVQGGGAERLGRYHPQIDLEVAPRDDRRLRVSASENVTNEGKADKAVHHRTGLGRRHQDVDIGDGVPEPPQAPAIHGQTDLGKRFDGGDDLAPDGEGVGDGCSPFLAVGTEPFQGSADLLLGSLPHAGQVSQAVGLQRPLQTLNRGDAEPVPKKHHGLRPYPRHLHQLDEL